MRGEGMNEVTEGRRDGWKEDWTDGNGGLRDRGTEGWRDDTTPYLPPSGSLPLPMPPSCKRKRPSLRPMQKSRESETGGEREGARGSEWEGGGGGREGGREGEKHSEMEAWRFEFRKPHSRIRVVVSCDSDGPRGQPQCTGSALSHTQGRALKLQNLSHKWQDSNPRISRVDRNLKLNNSRKQRVYLTKYESCGSF